MSLMVDASVCAFGQLLASTGDKLPGTRRETKMRRRHCNWWRGAALIRRVDARSSASLVDVPGSAAQPRVLMLVTRNQRRGAESFALLLGHRLRTRGLNVRLVSLAPGREGAGLGIPELGPTPLGLATLRRLRREIMKSDVVIACGSKTLPAVVLSGLLSGRPAVYQNIGDPLYWANNPLRRARVRAFFRGTAAVVALTDRSAEVLKETFGLPSRKLRVIPNARDSAFFRPPTAHERAAARVAHHIRRESFSIAIVGSLTAEKRVDLAIDAVGLMRMNAELLVVGSGPLQQELADRANISAPGRVRFVGATDDPRQAYWAADAVVSSSASEGVPGVLIEAGLCGLPIVCTDVGYVRDIVSHGVTGYVVHAGQATLLQVALEQAAENRQELGLAARQHCLHTFDLGRVAEEWAVMLSTLVTEKEL